MRKVLRRIIVLCMACMICMSGLCMAKFIKDDDGNWVEFYREDEKPWNIYYVDTNAIKVCEYEGKKYLDVSIRRKENTVENYVYYIHQTEVTNAKFHRLLDLENRKKHNIEWQNKYAKQKRGTADISEIKNGKSFTPWDEKLVTWVEQNYPAVINEIRTFNHSGQSAGTTNVTGAAGGSRGEISVGGLEYEVLDSGAVKLVLRRGSRKSELENYANEAEYWKANTYYIFTKPEEFNAWPGTYAVGHVYTYQDKEILGVTDFFDYDPMTKTVQFYDQDQGWGGDAPELACYGSRIRVIDRNTVYIEEPAIVQGLEGSPYVNKGPFKVGHYYHFGEEYLRQYTERYLPCEDQFYRDWNGRSWTYEQVNRDGTRAISYSAGIPAGLFNEIAILCCALHGNFGEMPALPNVQEFVYSSYTFPF